MVFYLYIQDLVDVGKLGVLDILRYLKQINIYLSIKSIQTDVSNTVGI